MKPQHTQFLASVLGQTGSEAMVRAVDRNEALESVLLPRSILSWINTVGKFGHDGTIPGIDGSHIQFQKSEDGFTGSVNIYDFVYDFEKASVFHLASSLALALDVAPNDINVKDLDIERLGKSIDMLIKAKLIKDFELDKAAPDQGGGGAGAIPSIPAAQPLGPAPAATKVAEAPKMAPRKPKTKLPIPSRIKVTKSEMGHKCGLCGKGSFLDSIYVGCSCLSDLAKSVHSNVDTNELTLGDDWDSDAILALLESIGRIDGR